MKWTKRGRRTEGEREREREGEGEIGREREKRERKRERDKERMCSSHVVTLRMLCSFPRFVRLTLYLLSSPLQGVYSIYFRIA